MTTIIHLKCFIVHTHEVIKLRNMKLFMLSQWLQL